MSSKSSWIVLCIVVFIAFASHDGFTVSAAENSTNYTIPADLSVSVYGMLSNETITIAADYSYENGTIPGIDICFTSQGAMSFNMSNGFYYKSESLLSGNYSRIISCHKEGYENKTDTIEFEVFDPVIDNDNDGYDVFNDCNDTNPDINPGEEEIFGNSIDDDCNAETPDNLFLNITTSKENYAISETVSILINAVNGSDTYITINTPTNVSYVYIFSNGNYPVTQQYSLTGITGLYSIEAVNYYGDEVLQDYDEFTVGSAMGISIITNKNEAFTNEKISFSAQVTNAVGNVNYIWNMDDGNEKNSASFEHSYSSARAYNIVLIATDQGGNQVIKSKQVIIKPQYTFKVKVIDNSTSEILDEAYVDLDGDTKETNSSGMVEYKVSNKTYGLEAYSDDYIDYDHSIKINGSHTITLKLAKDKSSQRPSVSLITQNKTQFSGELKFRFTDNTKSDCTLYVSEDRSWWSEEGSRDDLQPSTDYSFNPDLEAIDYYWKVHCKDTDGNEGISQIRKVLKKEAGESIEATETFSQVQDVYNVIPNFDSYGPDEKKVIEYLDMEVLIKDAKRKLEMANRDIFNLRNEPDTDSIIQKRDEIYERIDSIKDETPLAVKVTDKANFVKYIDETDLAVLLEKYFDVKSKSKVSSSLLSANKDIQKKVTIETNLYNVEIEYISGRKQEVTLIARKIDSQNSEGMYVEYIPKEIVETTDDIIFLNSPTILEKDPLFEIPIASLNEFVYYINNKIDLSEIPKIKAAVITDKEVESNAITGFAIFDKLGFSESNKKIFLIQLVVVFVLIGVYLYFSRDSTTYTRIIEKKPKYEKIALNSRSVDANSVAPHKKADEFNFGTRMNYLKGMIRDAKKLNLKDAAIKYHEIKLLYDTLEEAEKTHLYLEVSELLDDITLRNINHNLNLALSALASEKNDESFKLYEEIQNEFEKLSEESKEKIYSRCCELAIRLKDEN